MRKVVAAAVLVLTTAPTHAFATITSFAQYNQITTARDLVFKAASGGAFGGTLSSRTTQNAAAGTPTQSVFDLLVAANGGTPIPGITADFTFNATTTQAAATVGSVLIQGGFSGSFSFTYEGATPLVINGLSYSAGTNLLTGTFTNATLTGNLNGSSGAVFDSGPGNTSGVSNIYYTSSVVSFVNDSANDLALTLTSVSPSFGVTNGHLNGFGAVGTGSFSSDPVPLVNGGIPAPELGTWGMMVMGFGLIGGTIRSRRIGARVASRRPEFA